MRHPPIGSGAIVALTLTGGQVLIYVFGARKDKVFLQLMALLEPFGIKQYCTDGWGAGVCHLQVNLHEAGKQKNQIIERKYLNLRTRIERLVGKTICFSLVGIDA